MAIWPPNFFFLILIWVSKNAEFYVDFKCVEMGLKKIYLKSYGQKTYEKSAKS
jgi:hypothetical protein